MNDCRNDALFKKDCCRNKGRLFHVVRIGVAILGLEVPHAHIHLVPMNSMEDVNFRNPKLKFTPEEFKATAEKIREKMVLVITPSHASA